MTTNAGSKSAKDVLQDITADISWFIKKFKGYDGNGQASDFSPEEREQLREGLFDLADRIKRSAERL